MNIKELRKLDSIVKPTSYSHENLIEESLHLTIMIIVKDGKTVSEMAESLGMKKQTFCDCLKRLGISKDSEGLKLTAKRPGNRTNHKRLYEDKSLGTCEKCGETLFHNKLTCNWCKI